VGGRKASLLMLVCIVNPTFPNKKLLGKEHTILEREVLLQVMKGWSVVVE